MGGEKIKKVSLGRKKGGLTGMKRGIEKREG